MIKASRMSLACGTFSVSAEDSRPREQFESIVTSNPVGVTRKEALNFTSKDANEYLNEDLRMPAIGYEILKRSILNPKNHSYTPSNGTVSAREAIAKHYNKSGCQSMSVRVSASDVIVTHGTNMALFMALMSITNPGDNILVPSNGDTFFCNTSQSVGVQSKVYNLIDDLEYRIDLQHLSTQVDSNSRFLFVVNQSSLTGNMFSLSHMEEIAQFCRANNLFIISDESSWNQTFAGVEFNSFGYVTKDVPVIVIGGLEKTVLAAGWGISWMIFVDPLKQLNIVKQGCLTSCQLFLHPCSFLMAALPELLDELTLDFVKNTCMEAIQDSYEYLVDEFNSIEGFSPILAVGGQKLAVQVELNAFIGFQSDVEFLRKLSKEEFIELNPLSEYYIGKSGFSIMTSGKREGYQKLIPRIRAFSERHLKSTAIAAAAEIEY